MRFNSHSDLAGRHAFLSASKSHWVNYDTEKLDRIYRTAMLAKRGTEMHEFAQNAIRLGIRMPRTSKTINDYINDAIGFRMIPEQMLVYSPRCFGTADTISFRDEVLRVHDLKTGVIPGKTTQLEIYTALFCLEYGIKPSTIGIELRIYQNDDIVIWEPELDDIVHIMDRIVTFDAYLSRVEQEDLA